MDNSIDEIEERRVDTEQSGLSISRRSTLGMLGFGSLSSVISSKHLESQPWYNWENNTDSRGDADRVDIYPSREISDINPNVYGHFAEHVGRCIYGGIWVGENANVETHSGIRKDTVSLLRDLNPPVLRWPGGCFADDYNWKNGIGPREDRPRTRNLWWVQTRDYVPEEPHDFGTDEFMRLCDLLDTQAYLATNMGSESPELAADWYEYCNYEGDTTLANKRREYGQDKPYNVKYWAVGNESWGCGGNFTPSDYGRRFRRFVTYLTAFSNVMDRDEPQPEFVGVGESPEWDREFMKTLEKGGYTWMLDQLSVHRYFGSKFTSGQGNSTEFTDEEYYNMFSDALGIVNEIETTAEAVAAHTPDDADIGIAVDEWGVWHPEAVDTNGLEQKQTVRDALAAATVLDVFNHRADVVTMSNIAQTVNVLQCLVQTDEENAWPTPTYQVYDLYKPHIGATALKTDLETDRHEIDEEGLDDVPLISASASKTDEGIFVTLSNRDLDNRSITINTKSDQNWEVADSKVLFDDLDPRTHVTRENADQFKASQISIKASSNSEISLEAPGSSLIGLTIR